MILLNWSLFFAYLYCFWFTAIINWTPRSIPLAVCVCAWMHICVPGVWAEDLPMPGKHCATELRPQLGLTASKSFCIANIPVEGTRAHSSVTPDAHGEAILPLRAKPHFQTGSVQATCQEALGVTSHLQPIYSGSRLPGLSSFVPCCLLTWHRINLRLTSVWLHLRG